MFKTWSDLAIKYLSIKLVKLTEYALRALIFGERHSSVLLRCCWPLTSLWKTLPNYTSRFELHQHQKRPLTSGIVMGKMNIFVSREIYTNLNLKINPVNRVSRTHPSPFGTISYSVLKFHKLYNHILSCTLSLTLIILHPSFTTSPFHSLFCLSLFSLFLECPALKQLSKGMLQQQAHTQPKGGRLAFCINSKLDKHELDLKSSQGRKGEFNGIADKLR